MPRVESLASRTNYARLPNVWEALWLRIGLIGAGGLLLQTAQTLFASAPTIHAPANVPGMIGLGVIGLGALIAAGLRRPPPALRWLILLAFIAELLTSAAIWVQTAPSDLAGKRYPELLGTDSGLDTELAGALFLGGHNPFEWDYGGTMALYRTDSSAITATLQGAVQSQYPYPALGFLLGVPFHLLGLPATFCLTVLSHLAVLCLLFVSAPRQLQPIILLPLGVGFSFTALSLVGVINTVWAAFLVAMVLVWRRPTLRAVLFGLAIAFKQDPWLVAPFLLIRVWYDDEDSKKNGEKSAEKSGEIIRRLRRVIMFFGIATLTFLLINAPFAVANLAAWLHSVTEPFTAPYVTLSDGGLATLTQSGLVYLPKGFYLFATVTMLAALLICYWHYYATMRDALWILPGVFIWFSYRAIFSYWVYWTFPLLATLVVQVPPWQITAPASESQLAALPVRVWRRWREPLAVTAAVIVVLYAAGLIMVLPAAVSVSVRLPAITDSSGKIAEMHLEVTNKSDTVISPRIAVQQAGSSNNPIPWFIDDGPPTLEPAHSAVYHVSTMGAPGAFSVWDAVQVVVTDAGGNYGLRAVTTIPPDRSFLWPDAVPNPSYTVWAPGTVSPLGWELKSGSAGSAAMVNKDGRDALALTLPAESADLPNKAAEAENSTALETTIPFPLRSFGLWVYADPPEASTSPHAYGIETDEGQRRLWILFGSRPYTGPSPAQAMVNRTVPAQQWSYQVIDLAQVYEQQGWQIPALQPTVFRGLKADLRLITLRLFVAANGPHGRIQTYFGPFVQDYRVSPETLMAETFANPTDHYVRLGDAYLKDANYSRAVDAYRRALDFSPRNTAIATRLASAQSAFDQEYER